ncbi:MAG TPA: protein kinase [Vicinamibacterales bacterium]|nr:protein kinase [Vicinamibacterales bacterium]
MSGTPDDAWLIALGAAVSDGSPVDWEQAERLATDPEKREIVRNMRRLASVVSAHRSDVGDLDERVAIEDTPATVRHWRHIVLFEPIGAGAFGTVYRGWDPTLDRDVAVKLLPAGAQDSASPLDEARNLARVRHSNVVIVYGADVADAEVGIWMEYIEGRTLADIVREAGPMSAREVTGIGIDLCRALAALHGAGLLHRDIKPHNVMREFGGRIVLMDFSGAQAVAPDGRLTVTSGTPLYMAPELFGNGHASFASDVYSLGILLFFLLSGQLPVEGTTVAALKRAHADGHRKLLRDLRADVPDATLQVIERAIAPEPAQRYQTAGEFEHALASSAGAHAALAGAGAAAHGTKPRWLRAWMWSLAALLIPALIAVAAVTRRHEGVPLFPSVTRFQIGPPFMAGSWPRVSPNGRFIVFGVMAEGRRRFWVRTIDEPEGRAMMNTTATESPFFSPDSETLCFFADGKLKRIAIRAGDVQPEILADAPRPRGGDWSGRTIVFARVEGIYAVTLDANAVASRITTLDQALGEYEHAWPEFLPDGRRFLYIIRSSQPERTGLYLGSLDAAAPRLVMPAYSRVRYVAGYLFFVRQGILLAQRFDADRGVLEGEPVQVTDRVRYHAAGDGAFDVSDTGVLIYGRDSGEAVTRLMVHDGRGRELYPLTSAGYYRSPRFSPDGRRIVAEKIDSDSDDRNIDLYLYDIERGGVSRLTSSAAPDVQPNWSHDGQKVVFSSKRGAFYELFTRRVDATATEEPIITMPGDKLVEDWSPDGRYLSSMVGRNALWIFPLDPAKKPWMVRSDPETDDWQSEFSPDDKWLAYTSRESGTSEVYVEPFPATGSRWQVSTSGGSEPHWRGGRELLYVGRDGMLFSVTLTASGWENAHAQPLFRITIPDPIGSRDYAVSPDGTRIVVNTFIADPVLPPIDVVVNWPALLEGQQR